MPQRQLASYYPPDEIFLFLSKQAIGFKDLCKVCKTEKKFQKTPNLQEGRVQCSAR
jgi:hypothetical protein